MDRCEKEQLADCNSDVRLFVITGRFCLFAADAQSGPHCEDHPTHCLKHFPAVPPPGDSHPEHLPQKKRPLSKPLSEPILQQCLRRHGGHSSTVVSESMMELSCLNSTVLFIPSFRAHASSAKKAWRLLPSNQTPQSGSILMHHLESARACPEPCYVWPETGSTGLSWLPGLSGSPRAEAPERVMLGLTGWSLSRLTLYHIAL